MALDIEGIKARLAAASTGGQWEWELRGVDNETLSLMMATGTYEAFGMTQPHHPMNLLNTRVDEWDWNGPNNRAFIASAPTDIPDLLAEVESLRAAAHEVVTLADAAGPDTFWTRWNDLAEAVDKLREVVGL